jgi:hypothetical protein
MAPNNSFPRSQKAVEVNDGRINGVDLSSLSDLVCIVVLDLAHQDALLDRRAMVYALDSGQTVDTDARKYLRFEL